MLKGRVPLVFLDEFDSTMGREELFWLKYLLAPMQDGEFLDQGAVHPIGRSILVFAGGTASSYADFARSKVTDPVKLERFRAAKGPDFVSRLRGVLDLPGINAGDDGLSCATLMRRAMLVRRSEGTWNHRQRARQRPRAAPSYLALALTDVPPS